MFPTRNLERLVINASPIFLHPFVTPRNLKNGLEVPKASGNLAKKKLMVGGNNKIEFPVFLSVAVRNLLSYAKFVLKL